MHRLVKLFLFLLIFVIFVLLFVLNRTTIKFDFIFTESAININFLFLLGFIAGFIVAFLILFFRLTQLKIKNYKLKKELEQQQQDFADIQSDALKSHISQNLIAKKPKINI